MCIGQHFLLPFIKQDNQYAHRLDFIVVLRTETKEILSVDMQRVSGEWITAPLDFENSDILFRRTATGNV